MAFLNPTMASAVRTLSSRSRASLKAVSASGDLDVTGTSLATGFPAAVFACAFTPSHTPRATTSTAIGYIGFLMSFILPGPLRQPVEARRPFGDTGAGQTCEVTPGTLKGANMSRPVGGSRDSMTQPRPEQ